MDLSSPAWDVDLASLKATWRRKQAETHPDRMHNKSEKEQAAAAIQSSLINKAYDTLRDPLSRACYLLEVNGSSAPSESDSLEDPQLLMQVMELREQLEEAQSEEDVEAIAQENQQYYDAAVVALGEAFASGNIDAARSKTTELRYWSNIAKVCREWAPGQRVEMQH